MEFSLAGSDELLTLCSILNCYFILLKTSSPPTTTWDTSLHQKAAPCCHGGSARLGTPSENPNTSVAALEAQIEYFQPQVTSIHTNFTQQDAGMLSSHLETSWQGSRSKQLLLQ